MRIKYITNVRIPTHKAAGYAIMKMCSEFAKIGIETELFVPSKGNNDEKTDPFDFYKIRPDFEIKKIPGSDLLGLTLKFGRIFYWIDVLSFYLNAKNKIELANNDVIYSRDFLTALFFGRKNFVCLELHNIPKSNLFRKSFKRAKLFVVLNKNIKEALVSFGISEENILIAPSGVDIEQFSADMPKDIEGIINSDFVYGYIGTLKTMGMEKGVDLGIEALKYLPDNFKFLVVGGEPDEIEYYRKMSISFNVSNRVIFVGKVSQYEVGKYAKKCDVLIAPYPSNEHYSYYMSPLKIFEYMASGKPIIATDLPSIREVLIHGENASLIPPENVKALAEAINFLKESSDYAKKISENASELVKEKYAWSIRAKKIIGFLNEKK